METAKPYVVMVDDNFHYMDESERYKLGEFSTCGEAIAACRKLVDGFLSDNYKQGMGADELYTQYAFFGEDPFIVCKDGACKFSARDYAGKRCDEICGKKPQA